MTEADAAALHRAFRKAAEARDYPAAWKLLYEAVNNNQAGLGVLAELAEAKAFIVHLQAIVTSLAERVAAQSELLTRKALRVEP